MALTVFFQEMIILYIIGLIGFLIKRKRIINEHSIDVVTQLILSLTLPCLILYSMDQPYQMGEARQLFWLIPISAFILILSAGLASVLRRVLDLPKDKQSVFEGLIIFGNQGFIGFALISNLFPDKGALYVTLFNLPYLILIWTYGIYLFVGKEQSIQWKKIFLNPGIFSTLIGLLIFMLPVHWPVVLSNVFKSVGSTTIPLSMLLIGALIANMNLDHFSFLKDKTLWLVTGVKLLFIPLLLFPITIFTLPFPMLATAVLVSGMPAAPTIALYAQKFGGDRNYAAMGTLLTTLLSVVTIPILYILLYFLYTY
ncbi:AEC family transporter [Oceanobacillus alkalisoli]|uniref:AEC family transporter n=1 Tax=Oceanobacillus alkalisoli TaxID=2925113 RepID=UPI001EF06689|nr:AEC family transporter [Oceanobacillus alkalisoli]MCF3943799.1 AEC family transporter [Oceanobacillus alkalisoli]MCG5103739.1 AEC family transporter [Oceanobacillus alkalisoli]